MKKITFTLTIALISMVHTIAQAEIDPANNQQSTIKKQNEDIQKTTGSQIENQESIKRALNLICEVPHVLNQFIAEYPIETLAGAAAFGTFFPRLTFIGVTTGLIIKYKNTQVGDEISKKVDKAVEFLKNEWKDISDNYGSKRSN